MEAETETQVEDNVPVQAPTAEPEPSDTTETTADVQQDNVPDKTETELEASGSIDSKEDDQRERASVLKLHSSRNSNKSPVLTSNNSMTGAGAPAEDCEMRNLEDYEPGSSSLTTPLSSSDQEQTPRSSVCMPEFLLNFELRPIMPPVGVSCTSCRCVGPCALVFVLVSRLAHLQLAIVTK